MRNGWSLPNGAAFLVSQIFNLVLKQQATILSPLSDDTILLQDDIKQWNVVVVTVGIKPRPAEILWNTGPTVQAIKRRCIMSQLEGKECLATAVTSIKPLEQRVHSYNMCEQDLHLFRHWKFCILPTQRIVCFIGLETNRINSNQHTLHPSTTINFVRIVNTHYVFRPYWPS